MYFIYVAIGIIKTPLSIIILKIFSGFTANGSIIYRKYLHVVDSNGPYYTCRFRGTIHKGYYKNSGFNIDFRSINI